MLLVKLCKGAPEGVGLAQGLLDVDGLDGLGVGEDLVRGVGGEGCVYVNVMWGEEGGEEGVVWVRTGGRGTNWCACVCM